MTKKVDASYRFCLMGEPKAALTDDMDNPWCQAHCLRHDLMNWGKAHGWPLVHAQAREETIDIRKGHNRYYAIGPDYDLWKTACMLGTDHFMQALAETVLALPGEEA
jgi:hypothetical protein